MLGGVMGGRRNTFSRVDFTDADLGQTIYVAAEFVGCTFKDSHLQKVDFQSSSFSECSFEGELNSVLFYRQGFEGEIFPPNEMVNIDFTHARLRFVEFRKLDLDKVAFPRDDEHLILNDYPETLDRILGFFRDRNDMPARKLVAYFTVVRKWAGAHQRYGVINKKDVADVAGENTLAELLKVIGED